MSLLGRASDVPCSDRYSIQQAQAWLKEKMVRQLWTCAYVCQALLDTLMVATCTLNAYIAQSKEADKIARLLSRQAL